MSLFGFYWENPWFFLALLLVPLLLARVFGMATHGRVPLPASRELEGVRHGLVAKFWWLPGVMRVITITLLVLVVARPQKEDRQIVSGEGVDIMLSLDMSASMNAVDLSEPDLRETLEADELPRNRFHIARDILKTFIMSRQQDRIGLVVFGPQAWLKYPLTLDYARLVATLDALVLDMGYKDSRTGRCLNGCTISGAGTAIGDALGRSYNRLRRSTADTKLVILITDGKQEAGSLDPLAIARHLRSLPDEDRPLIFTFLVGSQEENWLPEMDLRGRPVTDASGRPSYGRPARPFPVDPDLLRQIAELTGGQFYESYNEEKFREDIADLERTVFKSEVHVTRSDVFYPLLLLAFLLLSLEWLLRFTRYRSVA